MDSRKPLTAGEIEAIREMRSKATPGPVEFCVYGSKDKAWLKQELCNLVDSSPEAELHFVGTPGGLVVAHTGNGPTSKDNARFLTVMLNEFDRLLSMLTPPSSAPLPVEVAANVRAARNALRSGLYPRKCTIRGLLSSIDSQARRLAEVEAHQCEICKKNEIERCRAEARVRELEAQRKVAENACERNYNRATKAEAERDALREQNGKLEHELAMSKRNERRWIAKGEEAIAERNAANKALEAIKRHQEIVAGTGTAQMSTTWKIANDYLRSRGAALAATEAE